MGVATRLEDEGGVRGGGGLLIQRWQVLEDEGEGEGRGDISPSPSPKGKRLVISARAPLALLVIVFQGDRVGGGREPRGGGERAVGGRREGRRGREKGRRG